MGRPVRLADCLMRDSGGNRLDTIRAHWRLRECMTQCQVLAGQVELWDSVAPVVRHRHRSSGRGGHAARGSGEGRRSRGRQRGQSGDGRSSTLCAADRADGRRGLAAGLDRAVRGPLRSPVRAQPGRAVQAWPVRASAATVAGEQEILRQCVAAFGEADAARTAAIDNYAAGGPFDPVLEGVAQQIELSQQFLKSLTAYNDAIAEYVVAVLPPNTPSDQLVKSLVSQ